MIDSLTSFISNQTNLALKGMIGIQAMSVIANLTGHSDDAAHYSTTAHDYITKWQSLAIAKDATPPHTTLSYGNDNSHGKSHSKNIPLPDADHIHRPSLQPLCRRPAGSGPGAGLGLPDAKQLLPYCR